MASKEQIESLTEDAICPICLHLFSDPATLECGHNFCRSCITQHRDREGRNYCPECGEEITDRTLKVNRALASMIEKARALCGNTEGKEQLQCEEHQEELKLFCETDKKLICVVCVTAREHRKHRLLSIVEAAGAFKEQMKNSLETLTKEKAEIEEVEQQQKEKISGVREQSDNLQNHITSVFAELQRFIAEKERNCLIDLREDEERILNAMETHLRHIQDKIRSIQEKRLKLQELINETDSLNLLKGQTPEFVQAHLTRGLDESVKGFSVVGGALVVGKYDHPFLMYATMRGAPDNIERVSVTLDVETAGPRLEVSEDRKMVTHDLDPGVRLLKKMRGNIRKHLAPRPFVLGSEGITSGRHYWETEVAGSRGWSLGVAAESVERKGLVTLTPAAGVWSIGQDGEGIVALTSPLFRLHARPIPGRVGVYLSYESGTVSFYNADNRYHIHTFTGNKFTEKLYPLFAAWNGSSLRMCSGSAPGV